MGKREFSVPDEYHYDRRTPARWIFSHVLRHWRFMVSFVIGVLITNVTNSGIPWLTGLAFDAVLQAQAVDLSLTLIALLILAIVLGRAVADTLAQFSMEVIAKRLERDARDELYLNLLGKSQTFHNRQRVGDIMARAANDVRELNNMMMPGFSLLFDSMMALVTPLFFIAFMRPELLLAPLFFTFTFILALRRYMKELNPVANAQRTRFGLMNASLAEAVTGIEVIKSAAQEPKEIRRFSHNARLFRDQFVRQGQVQARYLPPLLLGVAVAIALVHGLWLLNQGLLSIGELVAYIGLMFLLRYPSFISIFTFSLVQLGLVSAERILELMRQETEIDENETGHQGAIAGEIILDKVSFAYGAAEAGNVLERVSFRVRPGQTVAVVGQTGSGKSTLVKLVNRTYDPTEGRILVDGVDVRDWHLATLRSQISTIEQDIVLFSRSVAENIAFGLGQDVDQARIEQVAREAHAHDFIQGFREGYATEIGERGLTLSGGQRQRLAIARALLTDPRILILDDATSAVDSATEDKIQQAISRVLQGRTTLLITHRLSQIRRADQILVLRQGHLIDQGTHQELLRRCELYQRIFARHEVHSGIAAAPRER